MRTIEIKNNYNCNVIFSHTCDENTIKKTVEKAVKDGVCLIEADLRDADLLKANLYRADLSKADLSGTNLSASNLSEADLSEANLLGSDLSGADLRGVNLSGANLSGANLYRVDLRGVDLVDVNLSGADLSGADLSEAGLRGVDLREANLEDANLKLIKEDFYEILEHARPEIEGLKLALINGEIDGYVYEGECCCLIGTIAKCRLIDYKKLDNIIPNSSRPAEIWFMGIRKGDTPDSNPVSKITLDWINEFQNN